MRTAQTRFPLWLPSVVAATIFAIFEVFDVSIDLKMAAFLDIMNDTANMIFVAATTVAIALLAQRLHANHDEQVRLAHDLVAARAEGRALREKVQSHSAGVQAGLERQFLNWGLTTAEQDVGLLILKGFSHKEIASLRATSEATVRQQARAIYRKAGVPGKTAFAGYFIEDLLDGHPSGSLTLPIES